MKISYRKCLSPHGSCFMLEQLPCGDKPEVHVRTQVKAEDILSGPEPNSFTSDSV